MEVIKLTKKMLKMHPADLLIKLGAADLKKKVAYPQHVYFSREDYKELGNNLKAYAKKTAPYTSSRIVNYSVGMDLLNFGPNETLKDAVRPGWALVDKKGIAKEQ